MRKSDKKIDNAIRNVLTDVCDIALEKYDGFVWLTHFVNYNQFPESLSVVCVYDTNERLAKTNKNKLRSLIKDKLALIHIKFKDIRQHVSFDTEENCDKENNGSWNERFRLHRNSLSLHS